MSDKPKWIGNCTICSKAVTSNQPFLTVKTKHGNIHLHKMCMHFERRELKAEREAEA